VADLLSTDLSYGRPGEILEIQGALDLLDGGHIAPVTYEIQDGDPVAGIRGLANVRQVAQQPSGLYRVTMRDGESAVVDLEALSVAHSLGENATTADALGALYAAMGQEAMYATDPSTTSPSDPRAALGDAFSAFIEGEGALTGDILRHLAQMAQVALEQRGSDVTLNPPALSGAVASSPAVSARQAQRESMAAWRGQIQRVREWAQGAGEDARLAVAQALFLPVVDGRPQMAGGATLEECQQAAEELGCPIPELLIEYDIDSETSVGEFEIGASEKERIDIIRNAISAGDRAFSFRGPPGSGKGEMTRQIAAVLHRPWVPINVGPSSDLEQNIGGDGLRAGVVEYDEALINPTTGEIVLDGKGDPVIIKRKTVATASEMLMGPLAEAVSRPCVVEIMEPEGMEQEAIRLHSTLGEKFGEPGARYLNINSSAAGRNITIPVHPDCIIVFTYNPGIEDVKLKQATHDRCVNLDFDYPTTDAEARRLARMVNRVLNDPDNQIPDGTEDDVVRPTNGLREDLDPKVLEPFVKAGEKLRNAARVNPAFIEAPGARTMARMVVQMMMQAYQGDNRGDRTARLLLDYLRSYEEKGTTGSEEVLTVMLADELQAIQDFTTDLFERGKLDRGEVEAPEGAAKGTKAKGTTKAKPKAKPSK
jgi:MoxR-like ATPase